MDLLKPHLAFASVLSTAADSSQLTNLNTWGLCQLFDVERPNNVHLTGVTATPVSRSSS